MTQNYFDSAYFDPAYFETGVVIIVHAGGRRPSKIKLKRLWTYAKKLGLQVTVAEPYATSKELRAVIAHRLEQKVPIQVFVANPPSKPYELRKSLSARVRLDADDYWDMIVALLLIDDKTEDDDD
jgi:hypothetical protein